MPRVFASSYSDQVGAVMQHEMEARDPYMVPAQAWKRELRSDSAGVETEFADEQGEKNFYFGDGARPGRKADPRMSHALQRDTWHRRSVELEKEAAMAAELKHWNNVFQTAKAEDRERQKTQEVDDAQLMEENPFGDSRNFSTAMRAQSEAGREASEAKKRQQSAYAFDLHTPENTETLIDAKQEMESHAEDARNHVSPSSLAPFSDANEPKRTRVPSTLNPSVRPAPEKMHAYSQQLEDQIRDKKHKELTERQSVLNTALDSILEQFGAMGGAGAPIIDESGEVVAAIPRRNVVDPAEKERLEDGRRASHRAKAAAYHADLERQVSQKAYNDASSPAIVEAGVAFVPSAELDEQAREVRRVNIAKREAAHQQSLGENDDSLFKSMGAPRRVSAPVLTAEKLRKIEEQRENAAALAVIVQERRARQSSERDAERAIDEATADYTPFKSVRQPQRRSRDPSMETHLDGRPLGSDPRLIQSRQAYRAELEAQLQQADLDRLLRDAGAAPGPSATSLRLPSTLERSNSASYKKLPHPVNLAPIRVDKAKVDPVQAHFIHQSLARQVEEHRTIADQAKAQSLELSMKHVATSDSFEGEYMRRRKQAAGPADFYAPKKMQRQKSPKSNVGRLLNQPTETEKPSYSAKAIINKKKFVQ